MNESLALTGAGRLRCWSGIRSLLFHLVLPSSLAMTPLLVMALSVFAASWAGSGLATSWLRRRVVLDHPVERSSHVLPVPKGCGIAVTAVLLLAWLDLLSRGFAHRVAMPVCGLVFVWAVVNWLLDVLCLTAVIQ